MSKEVVRDYYGIRRVSEDIVAIACGDRIIQALDSDIHWQFSHEKSEKLLGVVVVWKDALSKDGFWVGEVTFKGGSEEIHAILKKIGY